MSRFDVGTEADPLTQAINVKLARLEELDRPRKILFVDDDDGMRMLFESWAAKFNCVVTYAADGATAVNLVEKPDSFDLVMLDISMPIMIGIEVFKMLRKRHGDHPPVVFFTGRLDDAQAREIGTIGFAAFIKKPEQFRESYIASMFHTFNITDREK